MPATIKRFLTHVLPTGFMRIRHYGFLANRSKKTCQAQIRAQLRVSPPEPNEPKTSAEWMLQWTFGVSEQSCWDGHIARRSFGDVYCASRITNRLAYASMTSCDLIPSGDRQREVQKPTPFRSRMQRPR